MSWVVDTCVVIDVLENDRVFGLPSAQLLESRLKESLIISPMTQVELSPSFDGDLELQKHFLDQAGIHYSEGWTGKDTEAAMLPGTYTCWPNAVAVVRNVL